jgi:hypothetical protein
MNEIILPVGFLLETPLASLYTGTMRGFDTPRQQNAGRVQVIKMVYIAAPRVNGVGVGATTRSSAKQYETKMFFDNITYLGDGDDQANAASFQTPDGQDYYIEPVSYSGKDVKVRCSCLDFYYRFSVWNNNDGSLLGDPPPPYQNKTDNREPVNPTKTPGLCKHLIALTDKLRQERFLR